ncbi:preprotein translocase subunit SecG [Patescibacteria group bacterium]|nr:preprotein translocase subunit SecG [Patescibacteria group bacterium]MBU1922423.1 preprotein translocase subunit SecG [Patescibacteria group bacterium]
MQQIFGIIEIVISIILIITILLQSRGSGLGAAFGGEGNVFRTKRGIEKTLFTLSIIFGALFFLVGLANTILPTLLK